MIQFREPVAVRAPASPVGFWWFARTARHWFWLSCWCISLAVVIALAGLAQPAQAQRIDALVSITNIDGVLASDNDIVKISGTVTNTGSLDLRGEINLRRATNPFTTRRDLLQWRQQGVEEYQAWIVKSDQVSLGEGLAPGQTVRFEFQVEARQLGLGYSDDQLWGPWGVLIEVATAERSVAVDRSYVIWAPADQLPTPRAVASVLPLRANPGESVAQARQRIIKLAKATEDLPIDWVFDPNLLEDSADAALNSLLVSQIGKRDLYALPWSDVSVEALANAPSGGEELLTVAKQLGQQQLAAVLGNQADQIGYLLWPSEPVGSQLVDLASRVYDYPLVLAEQLAGSQPDSVASGVVSLRSKTQQTTALIPDRAFAATMLAPTTASHSQSVAFATLAADLAWQTVQAGSSAVQVSLICFDQIAEQPIDQLVDRLHHLLNLPWLTSAHLTDLTAGPVERSTTVTQTHLAATGIPGQLVDQLTTRWQRLQDFAQITENPEQLIEPYRKKLVEPLAVSISNEQGRRLANRLINQLDELFSQVGVAHDSTVTMISAAGDLPVVLNNQMDEPVQVRVNLLPANASLVAKQSIDVELLPQSDVTVRLPVRALANGQVDVKVQILTVCGELITTAATLRVRVHAEWETVSTAVFAGIIAVAFVIGLIRSIRRRRRTSALAAAKAAL
ncbi:MAG: DUF6049 family protein [Bifidobacteriaceae bacterium]|jgi:hypothetical protein|nr:DUF6049 family protein [Bifidobacteriaceae bacterium]